jgi:hypothetical protein
MKTKGKINKWSIVTILTLGLMLAGCSAYGTSTPTAEPTSAGLPPATVPDFTNYGMSAILAPETIPANTATTITMDVFTVDVPDNAFTSPVEFEILVGEASPYEGLVPQGQIPLLAFAFRVTDTETGQLVGEFANPVHLTVTDPDITPKSDYFNLTTDNQVTENSNGLVVTDGKLEHPIAGAGVAWIITVP